MRDRDRRKHSRIDLLAQVQVTRDAEVHILEARNASRGGLFLAGRPEDHADLAVGVDVEMVLFAAREGRPDGGADVSARARVVRVEPAEERRSGGFGLEFSAIDEANLARLDALLARAGRAPRG